MTTTHTDTLGLGDEVVDELDKEKAVLERGGMNVAVTKATVALALGEARATHAELEFLKRQSKVTAELLEVRMERAYVLASGAIDMMMAAVEKNSPAAKVFQRLRSKIRRPTAPDAEAAEPLPVPDKDATK